MKYAPLGRYLADLPASQTEVSLKFTEMENIIGAKLPASASAYREWWANQEQGSRAPHWQAAGFVVDGVDLSRKIVRFRRGAAGKRPRSPAPRRAAQRKPKTERTQVGIALLLNAGFRKVADWRLENGKIALAGDIPKEPGVYAHVVDGQVYYIGSATMGLRKRLYFYEKPGPTQRTSIRVNALIADALATGKEVFVVAAFPEASEWNRLPVCFVTGLEAGLVRRFSPPWNKRGVTFSET